MQEVFMAMAKFGMSRQTKLKESPKLSQILKLSFWEEIVSGKNTNVFKKFLWNLKKYFG